MRYQVKNGEEIRNGKLYGWTGRDCPDCKGTGETDSDNGRCIGCAGTGEEWGLMPVQPDNLNSEAR